MQRKLMGIGAGLAAAVGAFVFATPASASLAPPGGDTWDHVFASSDKSATVYVEEHGDVFTLCDTLADGYAAHAEIGWIDPNSLAGKYFDMVVGNYGSCVTSTASQHDIPENGTLVQVSVWGPGNQATSTKYTYNNDH